jgi:hypothetical protein
MVRSLLASVIFFAALPAAAREPVFIPAGPDWDVTLDGQIRPRLFVHSGGNFRRAAEPWRHAITQRSRLGATVEEASGLTFRLQLSDVRAWGEELDTLSDFSANGLDVHQAYAHLPLVDSLAVRIGRQEIVLDGERLVGRIDWAQRGRRFDAARLTYSILRGAIRLDGLYAKVEESTFDTEGSVPPGRIGDVDFAGLHTSFEWLPEHDFSPLYLFRSDRNVSEERHTLGVTAKGKNRGFHYGLEAFHQSGNLSNESIDAYLAALRLGYTVPVPAKPQVEIWGELLSGGDGAAGGAFDTLYGTNHDLYGEMDFFFSIPEDTAALGLVDLGGRVGSDIVPRLRAHVDFHHFRTEDPTPDGEQTLGNELDAVLMWNLHDYVTLRTVYGLFLPGAALRSVRQARNPTAFPLPSGLRTEHQAFTTLDVSF